MDWLVVWLACLLIDLLFGKLISGFVDLLAGWLLNRWSCWPLIVWFVGWLIVLLWAELMLGGRKFEIECSDLTFYIWFRICMILHPCALYLDTDHLLYNLFTFRKCNFKKSFNALRDRPRKQNWHRSNIWASVPTHFVLIEIVRELLSKQFEI